MKMSQEEKIIYQINKMEDKLIRKQKSAQEKRNVFKQTINLFSI